MNIRAGHFDPAPQLAMADDLNQTGKESGKAHDRAGPPSQDPVNNGLPSQLSFSKGTAVFLRSFSYKSTPTASTVSSTQSDTSAPKRALTAAGHSDSFVDLGLKQIAKLTSKIEALAYKDFGAALKGAVPEHQTLADFRRHHADAPQELAAVEHLSPAEHQEALVLEKLGGGIPEHRKRELDIKLGKSTVSRGELIDQGHKSPLTKKAKLTLADIIRGSRSLVGDSRGYCLSGYNLHGKSQGHGRNELGYNTPSYLKKALDLPPAQREKNIQKILADLNMIREKAAAAPVTFVASSVFIAIDEENADNTAVRLIDLAHPIRENDEDAHADYAKLNRQFDEGIAHLIDECEALLNK